MRPVWEVAGDYRDKTRWPCFGSNACGRIMSSHCLEQYSTKTRAEVPSLSNPKCEAAQHFRRFISRLGLVTAAVSFIACAPDRSQWMARAAKNQATLATEDIGTVDQVRHGAKQEATFLTAMESAIYGNADKYAPQERAAYLALAQD